MIFSLSPLYVCTQRFTQKHHGIGNLLSGKPYILVQKIKTRDIRKVFDRGQKLFHEIVFLETVKQIDGTMGKCAVFNKIARNRKADRHHLWAGHHTGNSERISP